MRSVPTVFLLAISLVWQAFAVAQSALNFSGYAGIAHVVMHLENDPHHHDDDGVLQHDLSVESLAHVYSDIYANSADVVPTQLRLSFRVVPAAVPFTPLSLAYESVILEGPGRPPTSHA